MVAPPGRPCGRGTGNAGSSTSGARTAGAGHQGSREPAAEESPSEVPKPTGGSTMILVTGAAGLSGSAVVRELAKQRMTVRALARHSAKARGLGELPGVEVHEGDMSSPETLDRALEGVTKALMISSSTHQMVEVQCSFIDTAKRAGVR